MDLYEACENGNEERVVELLVLAPDGESPVAQLRARGIAGRTPLLAACMGGQVSVVRLLLGEKCVVYFTSRSEDEVVELLQPLVSAFRQASEPDRVDSLFQVAMVTKDTSDVVPMAEIQLPPQWVVAPSELLDGRQHVDDFGNTPLQCVSCFGCGSNDRHIDESLEITKQLLLHGDQPNLPKTSNKWTPLHWSAYNGNHEQVAILLDPTANVGGGLRRFTKTQISIPLLADSEGLFAVDIAGQRGLALREEMHAIRRARCDDANKGYSRWRLRLDHVKVIQLFIRDFLVNGSQLTRFVSEMNARNCLNLQHSKNAKANTLSCQDAVRYGQHLLYWAGCFGLAGEARELLRMEMKMIAFGGGNTTVASAIIKPLIGQSTEDEQLAVSLQTLYTCSCEPNKRQSVLHAAAGHGQIEILQLVLDKLLEDQQNPLEANTFAEITKPKKNLIVPSLEEDATKVIEPIERLETAGLVGTGWRNDRNETPLFAAVLHLQEKTVALFARSLSSTSLSWELQNVNVEGTLLHHVASEASRRVLGINHQSARPEYVMIFDGVRKKQFKESVIETVREESSLAPSLVATRAGKRVVSSGKCVKATHIDYLVLGATDEVLVQHAQMLQLKVKHRESSTRSKFDASSSQMFECFRSLQRQQVILSIVQRKINLKKHLRNGNIRTIFPLHDAAGCRNIIRHWGYTGDYRRVFQPFTGNSLQQFFLERKKHQYEMLWPLLTYFGEKYAFYYAFITFYTVWLLPIAVLGLICQILWLVDDVSFVPPLFAIVVSIWATLLVERWKRKRSEIQRKFGHFRRNRSEETPGFYGDFLVETTFARANAGVDVTFPRSLQLVRIYVGIPLLISMGCGVVVIFVAVKTTTTSSTIILNVVPWLPTLVVPYVVPLLNAVSMLLLDNLYTQLARALTTWENHRTMWQFESMLAAKLFWFKFLNAFISLFWIAFVDQDTASLRKQLLIIMGARQLWNWIMRDLIPMFLVRYRWQTAGFRFRPTTSSHKHHSWSMASHEWYNAAFSCALGSSVVSSLHDDTPRERDRNTPPPNILVQELMYPHDFLMDKQMEAVLQFGYITMFVSALPVAPLLALLSNVVAMRLDVLSCTQAKQRPPFESETEVSTFMNILEFMSFAAVAVNCAVLYFTTRSEFESLMQALDPRWTTAVVVADNTKVYVKELWVLLVVEHLVLGTKALLSLTIEDSASWVRLDEDRSDEEEKKRILDVELDTCNAELGLTKPSGQRSDPATVVATPQPPPETTSKFNLALAQQYKVALQERDEALQRERIAQQKLFELIKLSSIPAQLTSSPHVGKQLFKAPSHGVSKQRLAANNGATRDSNQPQQTRADHPKTRRKCFFCFALRSIENISVKRCLTCHLATCISCDEILHLDDLGVKEVPHFRVKISKLDEHDAHIDDPVRPNRSEAYQHRPARKRGHSAKCKELRRHVDNFVMENWRSDDSAWQQQKSEEVFERCCANVHIALRYLRNHERWCRYLEEFSNPAVSPAHAVPTHTPT